MLRNMPRFTVVSYSLRVDALSGTVTSPAQSDRGQAAGAIHRSDEPSADECTVGWIEMRLPCTPVLFVGSHELTTRVPGRSTSAPPVSNRSTTGRHNLFSLLATSPTHVRDIVRQLAVVDELVADAADGDDPLRTQFAAQPTHRRVEGVLSVRLRVRQRNG